MRPGTGLFPEALERLITQFAALPGVGTKSAQRMAFRVLDYTPERAEAFANAITDAKALIRRCGVCQNLTDGETCSVCASERRDRGLICVVADIRDLYAIERARNYGGVYHVLHGVISPMRRIAAEDIAIAPLVERVKAGGVTEVILALNPDTEGEATAMYISRLLTPLGVKVTRLATGLPAGGNVEFADDATIFRALQERILIYPYT
ncbi:MAG: recombination mediator RecR [Oscillospiraceae bacterium]|jgi:recombination protein RecR|nr:recombination mediator RecR [Oscillospiraceae bacterium]